MKIYFAVLFIGILLSGCQNNQPVIQNFNPQKWQDDTSGCKGYRKEQVQNILIHKEKLLGLSDNQLVDFLGKPDRTALHVRNQKFFYYDISSAEDCGQKNEDNSSLVIRFNATSLVNEITLYN